MHYLLLTLIYIPMLPHEVNDRLTVTVLAFCTGALILWSITDSRRVILGKSAYRKLWAIGIFFCISLIIAGLQLIPGLATGQSATLYAQAADALNKQVTAYTSVAPQRTIMDMPRLLTYAAMFWLGIYTGADQKRVARLLTAMVCIACVLCATAIYQHVLLLHEAARENRQASAPVFVLGLVRNHFATVVGIHMVIAIALLWKSKESYARQRREYSAAGRMNEILWVISFPLAALCILGTALVLAASRAGTFSSFAGIMLFCLLIAFFEKRARAQALLLSIGILMLLAFLVIMFGGEILERYANMQLEAARRSTIALNTLSTVQDFPLTGCGLGGYVECFRMYRAETLMRLFSIEAEISHAYNVYAETMLEVGVPAFMCFLGAFLLIAVHCLQGIFTRHHHRAVPALGVAVLAIVGVHSLADYSLQIPSIGMLVLFVLGISFVRAGPAERAS